MEMTDSAAEARNRRRRRRFTAADKERILAEAQSPGQSISAIGRQYGVSASLLFRWRKKLRRDQGGPEAQAEDPQEFEMRRLREEVRSLQRMLSRKTVEVEQLRQELASARGEVRSGAGGGAERVHEA